MAAEERKRRHSPAAAVKLRVRVPATTANLGPGFDCLGLALDWWNTIRVEPIARGLEVDCHCPDGSELPCDDENLVIRSMRIVFRRARRKFPPLRVHIECSVPVGRGLGSSASAIVGGVVAANALLGDPFSREELLQLANDIEGHPDNVAPALLGGFVISVRDGKMLRTVRTTVPRDLRCVLFIPESSLSTRHARNVLPHAVPRADAIYNVGRAALWMAALHNRQWDYLDLATGDRLHQPYRSKLIPGMDALFDAARAAGARGVALSGAGPSVIAFADRRAEAIARAMAQAAAQIALPGRTHIVGPSGRGARVSRIP
jgi:homoserine kinase